MKTIKTIILVLSFIMMNQFVNAEKNPPGGCKCKKPYYGCSPNNYYCIESCCFSCGSCGGGPLRIDNPAFLPETQLTGVFPNPFYQSVNISFTLPESQKVSLKIFDMNGRLIVTLADKIFEAGGNEIVWNASEVNAGVYFLQFKSAENIQMEKLIVTK